MWYSDFGWYLGFNYQCSCFLVYRIYRFSNTELGPFQLLSLGFILKIFLKFHKFQSQYSYKISSSETQGQSVGSGEKAGRKFSPGSPRMVKYILIEKKECMPKEMNQES